MVPNSQVLQDLVQTSSTPRLATTDGLLECLEQALSSQIREVHQDLKESAINTTAFRKTKSRRERVKTIYNDYFQQNKDLFIAFFSKDPEDKTRKHNDDGLISINFLTDVLYPHVRKTISDIKQEKQYQTNGQFNTELWTAQWGTLNDFEVIRTICQADIQVEKRKEDYTMNGEFNQMKWDNKWKHKYWFSIWMKIKAE